MERKKTLVLFMLASILVVGFSANEKAYANHVDGGDNAHTVFGDFTCWAADPNAEPPLNMVVSGVVSVEDQFDVTEVEDGEWIKAEYCTATEKDGQESPFSNTDPPLAQHYQSWFYPGDIETEAFEQQVILYSI